MLNSLQVTIKKDESFCRVQTVILVQQDRTAHFEREYVQLIGASQVLRHLLKDHEGMGEHETRDGIASTVWGICGRYRTRPRQGPRDTAMALVGGVRGKRRGGERDSGDMFLAKL